MTQEVEVARPVDRPLCGLTPGRRFRNQAFKEELARKLEMRGGPINGGKYKNTGCLQHWLVLFLGDENFLKTNYLSCKGTQGTASNCWLGAFSVIVKSELLFSYSGATYAVVGLHYKSQSNSLLVMSWIHGPITAALEKEIVLKMKLRFLFFWMLWIYFRNQELPEGVIREWIKNITLSLFSILSSILKNM